MKHLPTLLICLFILLLFSCGEDPKVIAISDYVQTNDGTKTDFKFKKLEFEQVGYFKGLDSARIIFKTGFPGERFDPNSNSFKDLIWETDSLILHMDTTLANTNTEKFYSKILNPFTHENVRIATSKIIEMKEKIEKFGRGLRIIESYYQEHLKNKDSIYFEKYRIKYKIHNPFIDADQEIIDTFYFRPGSDQVVFSAKNDSIEHAPSLKIIKFFNNMF